MVVSLSGGIKCWLNLFPSPLLRAEQVFISSSRGVIGDSFIVYTVIINEFRVREPYFH